MLWEKKKNLYTTTTETPESYFLGLFLGAKPKCTVKGLDTGECCPEDATKEINGDPVCEGCYKNFKHLITTNRAQVTNPQRNTKVR